MNVLPPKGSFRQFRHSLMFHTRLLGGGIKTNSFGTQKNSSSIQRIYVINLDRKPDRWRQISKELKRICSQSGEPLASITRRFSAIDARYLDKKSSSEDLLPGYSLADQLLVEPNSRIRIDTKSKARRIDMTTQEIAVALSHIEVWKLIASGNIPYTLVLEDDAYFRRGFCKNLDELWPAAIHLNSKKTTFDLLYLSFQEVGTASTTKIRPAKLVRKPDRGVWQASGYVLSQAGAKKLLSLLPAYGPVDLWLNLQFEKLDVLIPSRPIIEQRVDVPSTNSYSIMPVLSQIGAYTYEKPLVTQTKNLQGPVFVYGKQGTGLTALARALSMMGYTCCSDMAKSSLLEQDMLFAKREEHIFNAYVNVGSPNRNLINDVVRTYPNSLFIATTKGEFQLLSAVSDHVLYLPRTHSDKWAILSDFLKCEYPSFPYPLCSDIGQRKVELLSKQNNTLPFKHLKFDTSPWVVSSKKWNGIPLEGTKHNHNFAAKAVCIWRGEKDVNQNYWKFRDDTFPSNMALFTAANTTVSGSGVMSLSLKKERTPFRSFTSGAIVTRQTHLYGRFSANIRPSRVSGLITGIFLHRNSPHQEIDIEFLGRDTTKMLINVFYNPGIEGTKLEYGYRGTPTLIELGFDAAKEFHEYGIEWSASSIRWLVDEQIVHERVLWDPTPIPNLPMEFNINLWYSRSKELAGSLDVSQIPQKVEVKSISITQNPQALNRKQGNN